MMNVESESPLLLNDDEVDSSFPQVKAPHAIRRRGSLPFKKRRFPEFSSSEDSSDSESSLMLAQGGAEGKISQSTGLDEEKIAALALVAAAASGAVPGSDGFPEYQEPRYLLPREKQENHTPDDPSALSSDLAAAVADLKSLHNANPSGFDSPKEASQASLGSSPLPSGCHGLTSRTNSYCRRQPCYNGSNYCKLHFQHYVVAGGRDPVDGDDISSEGYGAGSSNAHTEGQGSLSEGTKTSSGSAKIASNGGKGTQAPQHQDKRYTGDPREIRCQATTTRGRDCAYCAVKDTKYCHLHADYDTNPAPRRGGASFGSSSKVKTSDVETTKTPSGPASVSSSSEESTTPGKSSKSSGASKRKGTSMSARRASTCKNMEKHMADAPYPLLSVLATDQWFNQKVIVSTGPLTNHVGHVEKWGNGWVSVRLPGVGLHNRRSFELYLHPDQDEPGVQTSNKLPSTDNQAAVPGSDDQEKSQDSSGCERDIRRCISRDKETSPIPAGDNNAAISQNNIHEITPLSSCKVIGIDQHHRGMESDVQRVKDIMFPLMNSPKPATVPESPLPPERLVAASTDMDGDDTRDSQSRFQLSVKTQSVIRKDDMPLVDLLAKEGYVGKGKFGLLFGTAALERGRRSIHRPTWYEPEANASKKRELSPDHTTDIHVAKKRKHIEDGIAQDTATPLVSSINNEESTPGV